MCFGTFNRLEILREAVSSLLSPDLDIEIVVVDGGSDDGTIEYLHENNDVVALFDNGRSTYPGFMNKAIEKATGDLLVQWNDDAFMSVDGWNELADRADEMQAAGFRFPYCDTDLSLDHKDLAFKRPSWMSFGCYRRETLERCGLYHPRIHFYHCDTELCRRVQIMLGERSLPYLDKCKVYHRRKSVGHDRSKKDVQGQEDMQMCKKVCAGTRKTKTAPPEVSLLRPKA